MTLHFYLTRYVFSDLTGNKIGKIYDKYNQISNNALQVISFVLNWELSMGRYNNNAHSKLLFYYDSVKYIENM